MVKPIKPDEVNSVIPDEVIEAFNEMISKCWNGYDATFKQKEVVQAIIMKGIDKSDIFEKHYLDIERLYAENGWKVFYDAPDYNASYCFDPLYKFTKKK